jgi:CobQ-like glutamine amidotransferase family enzyme
MKMAEEKDVVGYYTEDGNIYCVDYINKDREIMVKIEKAITAKDSEEAVYFCEGCEKEIK